MKNKNQKILLIIIPIILFILLAIYVQAELSSNIGAFIHDKIISSRSDILTNIIKIITYSGNTISVIIICLVFLLIKKTRLKIGLPVSISLIISALLNNLLKIIFARQRPSIIALINETGYSFPSGHTMNSACLYTMLLLLINKYITNKKIKIPITIICILMPILIGLSRIYLGVHYTTDVLGGYLLGVTIAISSYYLYNLITNKKNKTN